MLKIVNQTSNLFNISSIDLIKKSHKSCGHKDDFLLSREKNDIDSGRKQCGLIDKNSLFALLTQEKTGEKQKDSNLNINILSPHIQVYENSFGANNEKDTSDPLKSSHLSTIEFWKTRKDIKHLFSLTKKNPFEVPRQQDESNTSVPEVAQFKSLQKLLNPNKEKRKNEPENDPPLSKKSKEEELKDQLFGLGKFIASSPPPLKDISSSVNQLQSVQVLPEKISTEKSVVMQAV